MIVIGPRALTYIVERRRAITRVAAASGSDPGEVEASARRMVRFEKNARRLDMPRPSLLTVLAAYEAMFTPPGGDRAEQG